MFDNQKVTMKQVEDDPSLVFELIKEGHTDFVDKLLSEKIVSYNVEDEKGNNVIMRLLKVGRYDLVLKYLKMQDLDINHQNVDGDTLAHILVTINYLNVKDIIKYLRLRKDFIPNIKNNQGQTILDKSINSKYIYTAVKVLEDKRFNNIDVLSFKSLYDTYIKSKKYGKYARLTNLDTILDSLTQKSLLPRMEMLLSAIRSNYEIIKDELISDDLGMIDDIINTCLVENIS